MEVLLVAFIASAAAHVDPPPAVSRVNHRNIWFGLDPAVSLSVHPDAIEGNVSELVQVSWRGLPAALSNSWVGLYLDGEHSAQIVPLKYQFCNASATSGDGSSGRLAFRVFNYRANVVFRLFTGWERPRLIAESPSVLVRKPGHPTGLRLALTGIPGEVAITWTSIHVNRIVPRVEYEVFDNAGVVSRRGSIHASNVTYGRSELCGAPANAEGYRDPGIFYTARLQSLPHEVKVRYRAGSEVAWSRWRSFRTAPAPGSPVRIFAFGDLGQMPQDDSMQADGSPWYTQDFARGDPGAPNTTSALLADHAEQSADVVLHNGDLSYAMGYSAEWESFHDQIEPLSSVVPWMVTIGNHERDWPGTGSLQGMTDSLGECGVPTMRRFSAMPFASLMPPPHDEPWYVLQLGVVTILAVSTEHDLAPGSPQHEFLQRSLAGLDRTVTPWVLLAGHRPYHISSAWESDEIFARHFRAAVGGLIEDKVDLILGAHHHSYQRTCALQDGGCTPGGVVVVNLGMGGADLSQANATKPQLFHVVDDQHYGYCRIIANVTHLAVEYVRGDDRKVHDSLLLVKAELIAI